METTNVKNNGIAKISAKGDFLTKLSNVKKLSKEQISNSVTKNKGGKQKYKKEFLDNWKKEHGNENSSDRTIRNQIRTYVHDKYAIKIVSDHADDNFQSLTKNVESLKTFFERSLIDWKDYSSYPCRTGEKKKDQQTILLKAYEIFINAYDLKK